MESENTKLLYKILDKLDNIEERLEKIEKEVNYIKDSSDNMNEHISFVETVYDTVKSPFYFIMNKIKPIEQIPVKEAKQLTS
jgi:hypothetical protein